MNHPYRIRFTLIAVIGLLCFPFSASGLEEFKTTKLRNDIFLFQGQGGNIAVFQGKDGLLMIDDELEKMTTALKAALKSTFNQDDVEYIINTHWHGDHTGGNKAFGETSNIVSHSNVRRRLSTPQEMAFFKKQVAALPPKALPNITFDREMQIHFNDEVISLVHYPNGHTDGDSVVYFEKANIAHLGDHFFQNAFPFVDLGSGGNAVQLSMNIRDILQRIDDQTQIIPGHGALTDKANLKSYYDMLLKTIAEVKTMKSTGKSLAEAQSAGLSTQWASWGTGFIKENNWIEFIYESLN